ncbi:MAG TPA: hypothetical protein PLH56_00055 [Candidatus Omnitrophota bacterium]|nr:hypothetical protein [Candidatus Omnitrophota bacterium]HPN87717.1 hypothetical protein [Candidatus Omnitrophota bacterium]
MFGKKELKEKKLSLKQKGFLDKIFEEDIQKQANCVEVLGWVGLVVFVFLLAVLWTAKFDVTVPADHVKLVSLPSDNSFILEGEIAELYAASIKKGQKVHVQITTHQNEVLKVTSAISEAYPKTGTLSLIIKVAPMLDAGKLQAISKEIKNISLRVIVEQKRLVTLFLEKQE